MILRGKKQGKGTYYYSNGDIYEGDWEDSLRSGKGTLLCHKKGDSCRGEFFQDEFVSGVYTDSNGSVYKNISHPENSSLDGGFMKGRLFGYGRIEFSDGGIYDGLFKDGKRSGEGRMVYIMSKENDP